MIGLTACSATDPIPSPLHDGRYVGTRQSDLLEACGISQRQGTVLAHVASGHFAMSLFSPKTQMTGTVGENGRVRASGIWSNPMGGFPGVTVLDGKIRDNVLDGTATDFRCHTNVHLRHVVPLRNHASGQAIPE
ncbi:MAG: hypothetical protein M3Y22_00145 [Pseudomonadota bacterium]|nr:hypothetical protein [Pseudomonadota bacterium]